MRSTLHLVAAADYPAFEVATRGPRSAVWAPTVRRAGIDDVALHERMLDFAIDAADPGRAGGLRGRGRRGIGRVRLGRPRARRRHPGRVPDRRAHGAASSTSRRAGTGGRTARLGTSRRGPGCHARRMPDEDAAPRRVARALPPRLRAGVGRGLRPVVRAASGRSRRRRPSSGSVIGWSAFVATTAVSSSISPSSTSRPATNRRPCGSPRAGTACS